VSWSGRVVAAVLTGTWFGVLPALAQTITGPAGAVSDPPSALEHQRPRPRLAPGTTLVDDMILETGRLERSVAVSGPRGASYESFTSRPWEFGVLPIAFDGDVTQTERTRFFNACRQWEPAGVVCIDRSDQPTWVQVTKDDDGCYAQVGMWVAGSQPINLGPGCWSTGTIVHEIGHAFGLIHEHQRVDRDTYVTINYDAIEDDALDNFTRYVTSRLWTEYDFGSIMHYSKSAFAKVEGTETITAKPEYAEAAASMGQRSGASSRDVAAMGTVYSLAPRVFRSYPLRPGTFAMDRGEALGAMAAINAYYMAPTGLNRANGLSINGRPDFLGLAAWFFDLYVNTRFSGYAPIEARYNVMANITQTDEWRVKNPGREPATPFRISSQLPFDRTELLAVLERLDRYYAAPEGLQRPDGLSLGGQPDLQGIATWVVDVYMGARLAGVSPDQAWGRVVSQVQLTDEWRAKH
jgi:hypothetical protein